MRLVADAPPDLARYLTALFRPGDRSRRFAMGEWWERERDGRWVTYRFEPDPIEPEGVPDIAIDANAFASAIKDRPTQGDISDALRGCEPVEVVAPNGKVRVDYPNVPLKNKDGSLSKYGKRLLDLHAPAFRRESEFAKEMDANTPKVLLEDAKGVQHSIPARVADVAKRARGLRTPRRRPKRRAATP